MQVAMSEVEPVSHGQTTDVRRLLEARVQEVAACAGGLVSSHSPATQEKTMTQESSQEQRAAARRAFGVARRAELARVHERVTLEQRLVDEKRISDEGRRVEPPGPAHGCSG